MLRFARECGVVCDFSLRQPTGEQQRHAVFGWRTWVDEAGDWVKAEAAVVDRVSEYHATCGRDGAQLGDSGANQCRADALTLKRWLDRERTETIPAL